MLKLSAETKPFALCLLLFFLAWSIFPPLTAPNPPLDSVEQIAWGAGWQLGYYKHPPLVAWLYGATSFIGAGSWSFMWLSAASIAAAHICVWRAARHVVDPLTALWASALLQAMWLHNYFIPEFNQNVALIPLFAAAGLFAIRAFKFGKPGDWLALGVVLGLGMLAKYAMAVSALTIAGFFLADPGGRKRLMTPGPYLAIAAAALIFAPHALWMIADRGGTLGYVVGRAGASGGGALDHLRNFAECAGEAALILLLPALFIWLGRRKTPAAGDDWPVNGDAALRRLVLTLAFAPFAIGLLAALVAGFRIKTAWMAPFWEFTPLALLMLWRADVRTPRWRGAGIATAAFAGLALAVYCGANLFGPYVSHKPLRVHFPGAALAREMDVVWAQSAGAAPLRMVIGDTFEAGSAAYFSKYHPLVRIDDDARKSPWAGDDLKRAAGAVIVWNITKHGVDLPEPYRRQNPTARTGAIVTLPYSTGAHLAPARIGIAIVPAS